MPKLHTLIDFFRNTIYRLINLSVNLRIKSLPNVSIGSGSKFIKRPIIRIANGSRLVIGDNVIINSDKEKYHLNMHSPSKLLLDRPGGKIIIGSNTRIHGTCIHAYSLVEIGNNCLIAANTQIMDCNGHDLSFQDVSNRINTKGEIRDVFIESNVWIGTNVVVLPGVTIGEGSIISANSVVNRSIPKMCIAGGNPAVVLKQY